MGIYFTITTVFALMCALLKTASFLSCDIQCGAGNRCVMRRSTCEYPPCPSFTVCIRDFQQVYETPEHPGTCPAIFGYGPCIQACRTDGDCHANQKCCDTGCGSICRFSVTDMLPKKTGYCGRNLVRRRSDCFNNCETDTDCPGRQKCCSSQCGSSCQDPCYSLIRNGQRSSRKSLIWQLPFVQ